MTKNNQYKNELEKIEEQLEDIQKKSSEIIEKIDIYTMANSMVLKPESKEARDFQHLDEEVLNINDVINKLKTLENKITLQNEKNLFNKIFTKSTHICNNIKIYLIYVDQISQQIKLTNQIEKKHDELNVQIEESKRKLEANQKKLEKSQKDIKKELVDIKEFNNQTKKDLTDINKRSMENIAVFTAIIAIIVSVVVTSSSWLNNASSKQAIVAFVVPVIVVVLSIVILLSLVSIMHPADKGRKIFSYCVFILVFGVLVYFGIKKIPELIEDPIVCHEIIEISEYDVFSENNDKYYKFKINDVIYNRI